MYVIDNMRYFRLAQMLQLDIKLLIMHTACTEKMELHNGELKYENMVSFIDPWYSHWLQVTDAGADIHANNCNINSIIRLMSISLSTNDMSILSMLLLLIFAIYRKHMQAHEDNLHIVSPRCQIIKLSLWIIMMGGLEKWL